MTCGFDGSSISAVQAPTVKTVNDTLKIYPYAPGEVGLSIARFLEGGIELGLNAEPKTPVFHEGTGSPSTSSRRTITATKRC